MVVEWGLVQSVSIDDVVWRGISMIYPPRCPKKWACSVASWFWSLTRQHHGVGVESLCSVDVLLNKCFCPLGLQTWCCRRSTPWKSGEHLDLSVLLPHNISHDLYEWLNCAISRPVYGPKHSWAISDCGILLHGWRWYLNLKGFLKDQTLMVDMQTIHWPVWHWSPGTYCWWITQSTEDR